MSDRELSAWGELLRTTMIGIIFVLSIHMFFQVRGMKKIKELEKRMDRIEQTIQAKHQ